MKPDQVDGVRDVYLHDFDHQSAATWHVLDAAAAHRDLVTKAHGAATGALILLVPFVIDRLPAAWLVALLAGAFVFLTATTFVALRDLLALRLLQIHLSYAAGISASFLEGSAGPRYFSLSRDKSGRVLVGVPRLQDQLDPMGIAVRAVRTLLLFDAMALSWLVWTVVVTVLVSRGQVEVATALLGGLLGSAVVVRLSHEIQRTVSEGEARLANTMLERMAAHGIPAIAVATPNGPDPKPHRASR